MHHIADDDERKGVLQGCPGEHQEECDTYDHTGDGVGHKGNALDDPLAFGRDLTPGSHKRRAVGHNGTDHSRQHRHQKGVPEHAGQHIVTEHIPHMVHCKRHLVGPFADKRHDKHHSKDDDDHEQDDAAANGTGNISCPVPEVLYDRNLVVSDIVPLQIVEKEDTYHGGYQHDHSHHGTVVEVGQASQHLVVKHGGHHLILSAHGGRDTEIRECQEKALYEGGCQGSQQRPYDGDPEGLGPPVPHDAGDHHELLVNVSHGVVYQQEGYGQCIDHIAQQQSCKSVDVKELVPQEPGDEPLLPEGVDDGKAVGDGGQQHGQHRTAVYQLFQRLRKVGVVHGVGKHKGKHRGDDSAQSRRLKAVPHRGPEAVLREHVHVVDPEIPSRALEGF